MANALAVNSERPTLAEARKAIKPVAGLFVSYGVGFVTPYVVWAAARLQLTPTFFTLLAIAGNVWAAWLVWQQDYVLAGIVFLVAYVFDCVDGQLARTTGETSDFGAWLDMFSDRFTDFLMLFAIGFSLSRESGELVGALLGSVAVVVMALRIFDRDIRSKLGRLKDVIGDRKTPDSPGVLLRKRLKESVLFANSERIFVIILFLLLAKPYLLLYVYIAWGGTVLLLKIGAAVMMLTRKAA